MKAAHATIEIELTRIMPDRGTHVAHPDQELMQQLFVKHWKRLRAYARYYVRDESAAEDVAQLVFLRLLVKLREDPLLLLSIERLDAWLTVATRNAALDRLRRRNRLGEALGRFVTFLDGSASPSSESELLDTLPRALALCLNDGDLVVEEALDRLTPMERAVLLCWIEGMTLEAIAKKLGCTVHRVRVLLGRALAKLAEERRRRKGVR